MRHKPFIHNSDSGMTILELLVASFLGLLMLGMTFSATHSNQRLYTHDLARTRVNQNLRSAMDFIGTDVRQAGEQLPENFPAIELINGEEGAPDQLILRRNLMTEVLTLCNNINSGESLIALPISSSSFGAPPACVYGGQTISYNAWTNYITGEGGEIKAYIFNLSTREGEFITITGGIDSGSNMYLINSNTPFAYSYTQYNSAIYILEEWTYTLGTAEGEENLLKIIQNGDVETERNLVYGITEFQVQIILEDDTIQQAFSSVDNWSTIKAIDLVLSGEEQGSKRLATGSLNSRFFPRNVLSL